MSDDSLEYERKIRQKIEQLSPYECRSMTLEGESGNKWDLDGVIVGGDGAKGYIEVKHITTGGDRTYINHLKRAFTILSEFRSEDAKGALVVPERRNPGAKDWDALFESIDAVIVDEGGLFYDYVDEL